MSLALVVTATGYLFASHFSQPLISIHFGLAALLSFSFSPLPLLLFSIGNGYSLYNQDGELRCVSKNEPQLKFNQNVICVLLMAFFHAEHWLNSLNPGVFSYSFEELRIEGNNVCLLTLLLVDLNCLASVVLWGTNI